MNHFESIEDEHPPFAVASWSTVPEASLSSTPPVDLPYTALMKRLAAASDPATDEDEPFEPVPPKRPLSGYNLFFRQQRREIVGEDDVGPNGKLVPHRKVGFSNLAKYIAGKWKQLDEVARRPYEDASAIDKARYKQEKKDYKRRMKAYNTQLQVLETSSTRSFDSAPSPVPAFVAVPEDNAPSVARTETGYAEIEEASPSPASTINDLAACLDDECVQHLLSLFG